MSRSTTSIEARLVEQWAQLRRVLSAHKEPHLAIGLIRWWLREYGSLTSAEFDALMDVLADSCDNGGAG